MPTYTYRCSECSKDFTAMKTIADRDAVVDMSCPKCKSNLIKRVWPSGSSIGISFKGAGWYKDGYSKCHKENGVSPSGTAPTAPAD